MERRLELVLIHSKDDDEALIGDKWITVRDCTEQELLETFVQWYNIQPGVLVLKSES